MEASERWNEAQKVEKKYHQEISRRGLDWVFERFNISSDILKGDLLEVGCGTGGITYSLHDHGKDEGKIVGVDPILGKIPNQKLTEEPVIQAVGETLPFKDNTFDVVASINVLDHTNNPNKVIEEISRVIKSNGHFLFKINTYSTPNFINNRLHYIDRPHPHHFSPDEIIDMIHNNGMEISNKSIDSRELFSKDFEDWSIKWVAASILFGFNTYYINCRKTS